MPATPFEPSTETPIRLLLIKPAYRSEELECTTVFVDKLNDAPSYEALSYFRGTEPHSETILCNGVVTPIARTLYDALRHLRSLPPWAPAKSLAETHRLHSTRNVWRNFAKHRYEHLDQLNGCTGLLWVDALCLEEDKLRERALQAKSIGSIFRCASAVKVWIGQEDVQRQGGNDKGRSRFKAKFMPRHHVGMYGNTPIVLTFIAQALRNMRGAENPLASMRSIADSNFRNRAFGFPPPTAPEWTVIRDFFAHPWFQLNWVVQEVVLARRAVFLLGDWEIEWSALGQAAGWFERNGYGLSLSLVFDAPLLENDRFPVANAAATWRMSTNPDRCMPLIDLLCDSRNRLATQEVDKLYAVLGLAEELQSLPAGTVEPLLEPDYSKPVVKVFRDAALYIIMQHGNLDVFSHVGGSEVSESWPSWVPRWFEKKASLEYANSAAPFAYCTSGVQPLEIGMSAPMFTSISGNTHISTPVSTSFSTSTPVSHNNNNKHKGDGDKETLALTGIEVDVVQSYSDTLLSYRLGYQTYQEERDFAVSSWKLYAAQVRDQNPATSTDSSRYPSPSDVLDAFILCLTAGFNNALQPAQSDLQHQHDARRWFSRHVKNQIPLSATWSQWLTSLGLGSATDSGQFHEAFVRACIERRFFVTKSGYMGMGPEALKEEDVVTVLFGGTVPYVLRPLKEEEGEERARSDQNIGGEHSIESRRYRLVGDCYVPGIMEGQAVEEWKKTGSRSSLFELV